jgi:hypothetical protein
MCPLITWTVGWTPGQAGWVKAGSQAQFASLRKGRLDGQEAIELLKKGSTRWQGYQKSETWNRRYSHPPWCILFSENIKISFTFCNYIKNPKTSLFIALVYFMLFTFCYFICCNYSKTLCLTTTRWSWGLETRILLCRLPNENKESFFDGSREFDINPEASLCGKLLLIQHSALGVPTKCHIA